MADIAINPVVRRVQFTGNTGLGPFAFTFNILQNTDIVVYKNRTLLTLTTDYTVSIDANGTGSVTLTGSGSGTALVADDVFTLIGGRELSRTTDFVTAGDLLASSLNEQLDSNVIMSQQLDERFSRTIRVNPGDADKTLEVPSVADRADKILKFDSSGNIGVETASALFSGAVVGANFTNNTFTGDGSKTAFTTTVEAGSKNNAQVYIDGVYQLKSSFSVSGTTLTFTEAPPLNSQIEVIIGNAIDTLDADSGNINYNQGGTGAQTRTVESKLQESVSVDDFGAAGDGVTDDYAAFLAAYNALPTTGGVINLGRKKYLLGSTLTLAKRVTLLGQGTTQTVGDIAPTLIYKSGSLSGNAIYISSDAVVLEGFHLRGQSGNSGDGIQINNSRVSLRNVTVSHMGNDGVRVGTNSFSESCSYIDLYNVYSVANTRDGLRIDNDSGGANAGRADQVICRDNGANGIIIEDGVTTWVFQGMNSSSNTTNGIRLASGAQRNTFLGGNVESNTNNDISVASGATANKFIGVASDYADASLGDANNDYIIENETIKGYLQSVFKASLSSDQAVATGTAVKLTLSNQDFDSDGYYDHTTNYRHTPLVAGWWEYTLCVSADNLTSGKFIAPMIYKNGSSVHKAEMSAGATGNETGLLTALVELNGSTDYVEFFVEHNQGSNMNILSGGGRTFAHGKLVNRTY